MPASVSPLALILPRPQISSAFPRFSSPSSAPRTPNRSPVAHHILLSPPPANRTSTDSWNSSNHDFEDPNAEWKEEEVRLLLRTLDALPAHLITPFNGSVPPSNLLDRIARGISAAKGPNDWPHSIRATRIKLLELARLKPQEEKRRGIIQEDWDAPIACKGEMQRERTPEPAEVLQPRTNTPIHIRRPLYRQSSMDFMNPAQPDQSESIARLSTRLQRHDRVLHHPYLRPAQIRRRSDHNSFSPSTPSSSTLNSNRYSVIRKSTVSSSSASTSSFGSPMSISAPLRPSSLRRASTITLASTNEMQLEVDVEVENVFKNPEFRRSCGYPEAGLGTKVGVKVKRAPSYNGSKSPATPINKKARKGHKPQLSISSDEEEKARSKSTKKPRTREPSWTLPLASLTQPQPRSKTSTSISTSTSSQSSTDNDLSTASTDTVATTVSTSSISVPEHKHKTPRTSNLRIQTQSPAETKKPIRRNPVRNPSMFGPELPCPQPTPTPPSRIPVLKPVPVLSSPVNLDPSTPVNSLVPSRPRTLRRAARRISFGNPAQIGSPLNPPESPHVQDGETMALGSAFHLA
ncbi:hypothetical protein BU15DRAFT_43056 [Melanogaster broomeanus]|nr:hypothetical protein BU15DRAFT_43056 [Melanogaster broomeanus]